MSIFWAGTGRENTGRWTWTLTPSRDLHEAAWVSPLQIYRLNIYSNTNITVIDPRPCLEATDLEEFVIERQFPRIPATITVRM